MNSAPHTAHFLRHFRCTTQKAYHPFTRSQQKRILSKMTASEEAPAPFPPTRLIVTGHTPKALAHIEADTLVPSYHTPDAAITPLWSCNTLPADTFAVPPARPPLVTNGAVFRIVDFPPNSPGIQHRSVTLDYAVVLKGSLVLTLDDGSRTRCGEGDTIVQRATMHGWANEGREWARMLFVLVKAEMPVLGGKKLEEEVSFSL